MSESAAAPARRARWPRVLLALVALVGVVLALLAFALPPWLKSFAEAQVAEKSGHRLHLDAVRFDPFALALRIEGLKLDEPDGKPLLAFRELLVDISGASISRRALVFDTIRLDAPQASVALLGDGRLNWSALVEALKTKDDKPDEAPPRIDIEKLVLAGGRIDFADRSRQPAFETRLEPLELELDNVSTLPNDQGHYHLSAKTAFGAAIDWRGRFTLAPLAVAGNLAVGGVELGRLQPYLRPLLRIAPPEGKAELKTEYRVAWDKGRLDATLDQAGLAVTGLALRGENATAPTLALDRIELKAMRADLATRKLAIGELAVGEGRLALHRRGDGRLDVEDWVAAEASKSPATAAPAKAAPAAAPATAGKSPVWQAELGRFGLAGLAIRVDDQGSSAPRSLQVGRFSLSFAAAANVGGDAPAVDVRDLGATLDKLSLAVGKLPPLTLERIALEDGRLDLAGRRVELGRIRLEGGRARLLRSADGSLPLLAALQPPAAAKVAPAAPAAAPWHWSVGETHLSGFEAELRDEGVSPAGELGLRQIAARLGRIGDDLGKPLPLQASLQVTSGGRLEVSGKLVPATAAGELKLDLAGLSLKPAQPYLGHLARVALADGKLSTQGRLTLGAKGPAFRGGIALADLRIVEAGGDATFLAWKSLATTTLAATPQRLDIAELTLDGLDTKLVIDKDKSVNVAKVLKSPGGDAASPGAAATPPAAPAPAAPATPAAPSATPTAASAPDFLVNIDRLRLRDGDLDFSDLSLALPFGTRIHHLEGTINGLSSRPGGLGQIELDGQVDDYGLARAVGQVNFFAPTDFMDLKVVFRNVEMARLTPYTATFAGRKIASGKLSLDLEYKIDKRQLRGDNQVVMERLTLGERVEAPGARDLPLELAIAILEDSDGRIDLGLPVSGSLDDPQFSYGAIVWKAILNVITKIATAPFRALGALFGGGEKFEKIAFEPGAPGLTPPEREKLARLAEALKKRPALALTVQGVHADVDRPALQDRQLRQVLAGRIGLQVKGDEDPGPMSTQQPKVREALEKLFAERQSAGELAALKDGFRQANPGQLEESAAGKMMSRLSGLFREQRKLDEQEVASLKGADFHATLYDRLRRGETVADARLVALATARGEAAAAALKAAGAPADRIAVAAPEKITTEGRDVPMKLALGAAKKAAP